MFSDSRPQLMTFGRVWYIFWYILFYSSPLNQFSKWRPPPSWIFSEVKSEGKTVFGASFLAFVPNFVQICSTMTEMAVVAILDFAGIEF